MKMFTLAFAAVALLSSPSVFSAPPREREDIVIFAPRTREIDRKLQTIVIPKIDLRNVTVAEAIEYLRQKSKALDPEGHGVNIVLQVPSMSAPMPAKK